MQLIVESQIGVPILGFAFILLRRKKVQRLVSEAELICAINLLLCPRFKSYLEAQFANKVVIQLWVSDYIKFQPWRAGGNMFWYQSFLNWDLNWPSVSFIFALCSPYFSSFCFLVLCLSSFSQHFTLSFFAQKGKV